MFRYWFCFEENSTLRQSMDMRLVQVTRVLCCLLVFVLHATTVTATSLAYVRGSISLTEVNELPETAWISFEGEVYNGLNNGVYWVRIVLDSLEAKTAVLRVPNSHINDARLYYRGDSVQTLSNYRYTGFQINQPRRGDVCFLRVNCEKEAIIPIEILPLRDHERSMVFQRLIFAAYYGFVLAVILFNLNFFFYYRDDTYLYYLFLMVAVNIPPAIKDGLFNLIFHPTIVADYIEPLSHMLCGVAAVLFTFKYLDLVKLRSQFFKTAGFLVLAGLVLFFTFLITKNFSFYVWLDVSVLALLTMCVGLGISQFSKSAFARFFTLAYFPLLVAAYDSYLCTSLGIEFLQLSLDQYRLGTGLELFVFTVAIGYKGRIVARENKEMRLKLKEYTTRLEEQHKGINESKATVADLLEHFKLTLREIDVLKGIAKDKTYREIAEDLFVSENTVKFHARNIFAKLQVKNRQEAGQKYIQFPGTIQNEHGH